jgi:uncharacterized protein YjbI with pentapeptide repeats
MADRSALTAEEFAWLTRDPPRDTQQALVPWTLADRSIEEVAWTTAVEHQDLTLERIDFESTQWEQVVFRRCRFRAVKFTHSGFAHARFEDVVFENCRFEETVFRTVELLRCRFEACEFEFSTVLSSRLHQCTFERSAIKVLNLNECDLSGTCFADSKVEGLRAPGLTAETLELRGGQLIGADLTNWRVRTLQLVGVETKGLRISGAQFERAALSGARISDSSFATSEVGVLALFDCPEIQALRVLESKLGELRLENCEAVPNFLIADTSVTSVILRDSVLYDSAFERVTAGPGSRMTGGALVGALFSAGAWAGFDVSGATLAEYVAVLGTHFEMLRFSAMQVSDPLDLRLEGDGYGQGSMTWSDARGA